MPVVFPFLLSRSCIFRAAARTVLQPPQECNKGGDFGFGVAENVRVSRDMNPSPCFVVCAPVRLKIANSHECELEGTVQRSRPFTAKIATRFGCRQQDEPVDEPLCSILRLDRVVGDPYTSVNNM